MEKTVNTVSMYTNLTCDFTFTLGLLFLILWFLIKRQASDWPIALKLQIAILLLMVSIFDIRNVYMVKEKRSYQDLDDFLQKLDSLAGVLFIGQHWYFTSHYLKVACFAKMIF